MTVTAEATAPYGEWCGSAAFWWEAVRSARILLKGHSKVVIRLVPRFDSFTVLDITHAE